MNIEQKIIEQANLLCKKSFMNFPDYDQENPFKNLADALTVIIWDSLNIDCDSSEIYDLLNERISEPVTEPEKTYYLLGEDATNEYFENGIEGVIEESENNNISFATFVFIETVTRSAELAEAMDGWWNYAIITEEEFNKL
jgi:hypothetical protein